jgi:release factor glutamine methyltransferase
LPPSNDRAEADSPSTVGRALDAAASRLSAAGIAEARLDAGVLLGHCLGCGRLDLVRRTGDVLAVADAARYAAMIARRCAGEPVSRIIGRRGFWTLDLEISPDVLDPRADSETLVETTLALLEDRAAAWRIADFGTGSGALLLAVLSEYPNAWGVGVDRSPAAARLARRNAQASGLAARAAFVVGDWGAALDTGFDAILCNPPYIADGEIAGLAAEVRDHDPRLALAGGADGLDAYRAIAADLGRLLQPGGFAVFECGAGQAGDVAALCNRHGLQTLPPHRDLAGIERCVAARLPR